MEVGCGLLFWSGGGRRGIYYSFIIGGCLKQPLVEMCFHWRLAKSAPVHLLALVRDNSTSSAIFSRRQLCALLY